MIKLDQPHLNKTIKSFPLESIRTIADNCPLRKIAPRSGLGSGSRLGFALGLGGNQVIALEENYPQVRVMVWVGVSFGVGGGQFSSGQLPMYGGNLSTNASVK